MSKNLIKNVASLSIVQLVNYVFPLITVPYVSRIIGPEGYGIINYATAFIAYFTLLIAYGFDLTATRRISKETNLNTKGISQIVSEVLSARIFLFIISVLLFIVTLIFFEPLNKDPLVAIILFIGCIGNVFSPQFIFQGFQELSIFAKANFVRGLINTILVFILIKETSDYVYIPVLTSFFLVSINITLFAFALRRFNIKIKIKNFRKVLDLIYIERIIFFSTVVISLYTTTNTVILGFFVSKEDVGYLTTSQNLLSIIGSIISAPLSLSLYPFIGGAFGKSEKEGILLLKKITPVVFYLTITASLFVFIFAPILVNIIYGISFTNSILPLRILAFVPFIVSMSNILGIQLMLNMGLDKLFFKITSIACVLGIVLNIFMSKNFGYIGTAWNVFIVEFFVTFMMFIIMLKRKINLFEIENFKLSSIMDFIKDIRK